MMTDKKPQLYNDLHPEKSLQNTGFKDSATALNTIKIVSKRCLKYQFDVINTMYNRAKFHPYKTQQMDEAMVIFHKWLKKYPKIKKHQDEKYKLLTLGQIQKYENIYNISEKHKQFLEMYKKVNGKAHKLQYIPIISNKANGYDYLSYRIKFINSRLNKLKNIKLYNLNGSPTKQHVILLLNGYSPDKTV